MSVSSHSVSDFEWFCKFVHFYYSYLEIPKQANTWLPQSLVPVSAATWKETGWRSFLCWGKVLVALEYPSRWHKNIHRHNIYKIDIWCPGGGTGHLCRPKDRLWGTSVQERTWDELAIYCNVFTVTWAPMLWEWDAGPASWVCLLLQNIPVRCCRCVACLQTSWWDWTVIKEPSQVCCPMPGSPRITALPFQFDLL